MAHSAMQHAGAPTRRYLRPQDLARLRHMQFRPRQAVRGHYAGRHRSHQHGHSVEFNDYRQYAPGDDVGDIDWKVYGRSNRLYLKLFEHQTDMTVALLVDSSMSMGFRGADLPWHNRRTNAGAAAWLTRSLRSRLPKFAPPRDDDPTLLSKFELACHLAAAVGFLVTKQQDRVSLGLACRGLHEFIPPAATPSHLDKMLALLETSVPEGPAKLGDALLQLSQRLRRRSIVMVFSDLWDDRMQTLKSLSILAHRGHELVLFHTLHEHELRLPDVQRALLVDCETNQRMRLDANEVKADYQQRMDEFLASWRHAAAAQGVDYNLASTAQPYHVVLERYLFNRAGRT